MCTKLFTGHSSTTNCTNTPVEKICAADSVQQMPNAILSSEKVVKNTVRCIESCVSSKFITNGTAPDPPNFIHAQILSKKSTEFATPRSVKTGLLSMWRMACGLTYHQPSITLADRPSSAVFQIHPHIDAV